MWVLLLAAVSFLGIVMYVVKRKHDQASTAPWLVSHGICANPNGVSGELVPYISKSMTKYMGRLTPLPSFFVPLLKRKRAVFNGGLFSSHTDFVCIWDLWERPSPRNKFLLVLTSLFNELGFTESRGSWLRRELVLRVDVYSPAGNLLKTMHLKERFLFGENAKACERLSDCFARKMFEMHLSLLQLAPQVVQLETTG